MTRNAKYPLDPLREHRDHRVDAATVALGDAVRGREAADDAKCRAEAERRDAETRASAVRREEAKRLANGELSAADLARAQAWEHATSAEIDDLGRAVVRADGKLVAAQETELSARAALAEKKADLDVVVKDQARFDARVVKTREAAEEEAAEDAFAARRKR